MDDHQGQRPGGMLAPVVPAELRAKASRTERDPFAKLEPAGGLR